MCKKVHDHTAKVNCLLDSQVKGHFRFDESKTKLLLNQSVFTV
jgi:hypothetical protein